jgi:hypothetical protein
MDLVSKYYQIIEEYRKKELWEQICLDEYTFSDMEKILDNNTALGEKYFAFVEKHRLLGNVLSIILNCPKHAENLHEILSERPNLLSVYSHSYNLKHYIDSDSQFRDTRINCSSNLKEIAKYTNKLNSCRKTISDQMQTEQEKITLFGGVVTMVLTKIEHPYDHVKGIYIFVGPSDRTQYNFSGFDLKITAEDTICTASHIKDYSNIGYMPREYEDKIDESQFLNLFLESEFKSKKFCDGFENIAEKMVNKMLPLARKS